MLTAEQEKPIKWHKKFAIFK